MPARITRRTASCARRSTARSARIAPPPRSAAPHGPTPPTPPPLRANRPAADCTWYSDWQALGDVYSFKKSGQPGKVTRVMCCTPEEKEKYLAERKEMLELMDTHIAPSFTVHPRTKDV
jgi:hypothetical protein